MIGSSRNIWDFEPRSVPGCGLWLDAADSSAVTIATGVSAWRDKSGNAYNLTQSTTGSQPSYASNLITFSNNTYLNIPQAAMNNLSTWSLFFVINPISSSNWIMSKQRDSVDSYNILSMTYNTNNFGQIQSGSVGNLYWRSMNAGTQLVSTAAVSTSTLQICNLTYDGTNLYFYKNGVLEKTTNGSFAIQNQTSPNTYTLGALIFPSGIANSGVTNFRLGEMIFYSSFPSTTERQQVEGYLSRKWGITLQNLLVPLTVSNCVLWLDADDSTKFTGGTTWLDKSGTNNHGINGTPGASTMPTVTTWTNGRKAARFVLASKNSMKTTNSIANFASYFMVARIQAAVGYGMLIINNLDGQRQFVMNTTSFPVALFWAPGGTSINLGSFAQGQGFVFCGTVTSGSGVGHMNGVQVGSNTNPSTSGSSQNYFGSANGDGGYLTIDIAEIMIYTGVVSSTDRQSIENYLSAKWNIPLSRSGVTLHPFNSIRPFLRQFNPIDISGCVLWLDGADLSSITLSNSNVNQWNDKSGNGYNFVKQGSFAAPVISNNAVGSLSAVSFTGNNIQNDTANQILTNASFPLNSSTSGYSIFVVSRQNGSAPSYSGYNYILSAYGGTAGNGLFYGTVPTSKFFLTANGTAGPLSGFNDLTANVPNTVMTTLNQTSIIVSGSVLTPYLNGVAMTTKTGTCVALTGISVGNAYAPGGGNFTGQTWGGIICEVLIFNSAVTTSERQEVEGYLAYKWGLVSPLPATHSYKKLPPSSSLPFLPTGISGCQLWLDGVDPAGTGVTPSNGTTISRWVDKSGNSYNATANAGGSAITMGTLNNIPAITFPAASTAAFLLGSSLTLSGSNGYSIFFVANQTAFGSLGTRIFSSTNNGTLQYYLIGSSSPAVFGIYDNGTSLANLFTIVANTPFICSSTIGPTMGSNLMTLRKNGGSYEFNSGTFPSHTSFYIGNWGEPAAGYAFTGQIGEFLIYNSVLTTSQRQQVEGYLAEKWKLKSSLPSTHLYRSFPPSFVTPIVATSSSSIVTTNLIVNLDPVSYTASSTSWPATVGNTWTFSSAPSIVSTTTSVALSFNGSQYVMDQTGFTTGPASTSSFTIEVWFYAASGLTNNIVSEMGQAGSPGTGWNVSMMYIVSSTIQVAFWVGGVYTLSLGSYSANTWTHACYTYSGTTVTGYKNGVSVATGTASKQNPGRGYYCLAGSGNPIYSSTACRIGGFRIYSSVLSAAQVTQNYNAYAPRFGLSTI